MPLPTRLVHLRPLNSGSGNLLTIPEVINGLADMGFPDGVLVKTEDFKRLLTLVRDEHVARDPVDGIYIDIVRCRVYPQPDPAGRQGPP